MEKIKVISKYQKAILIEDAAEALSATYKYPRGTFGNLTALSLVGVKKIIGSSDKIVA